LPQPVAVAPLTITYEAWTTIDLLQTGQKHFTAINPTLGWHELQGGRSLFFHANNLVHVKRGTEELTDVYSLERYYRIFDAPIDAAGAVTGPYVVEQSALHEDPGSDLPGHFTDTPGPIVIGKVTASSRWVYEFILGIRDVATNKVVTSAGAIYYHVLFDIKPTEYRVWLSKQVNVSSTDWKAILKKGGTSPMPDKALWKTPQAIDASVGWHVKDVTWTDYEDWNDWLGGGPRPP
jgi:hypothetical protein